MTSEAIKRPIIDLSNHGGEYTPRHDKLQKLVLKRPDIVVLKSRRDTCPVHTLADLNPNEVDDWANLARFEAFAEVPLDAPFDTFADVVIAESIPEDEMSSELKLLVLVEIKTKLTSLGSTLRQINSYLKYGAMGKKFSRAILLTENPLDYDDSLFFHQNGIYTVCKEEVN